jgi:hypothetical protein
MNETTPKTCPACEKKAELCGSYVRCTNPNCCVVGPNNDPRGENWNRMPRREQKAESRWYYDESTMILRQYPETLMYCGAIPAGGKTDTTEADCIRDHDKRLTDPEARALIAKWQKPSNPTPATEPTPVGMPARREIAGRFCDRVKSDAPGSCNGCAFETKHGCGCPLDDAECGPDHIYVFATTPPTTQPQTAPERVYLGSATGTHAYVAFTVPQQDVDGSDLGLPAYVLASLLEAKADDCLELDRANDALKQERDHASDMANAATARVADLEEKLSASRKLAQLYLEGRNQEWGRAEELQRRISVIQEAVRDIPTQFSGKAVPLG